MQEMYKPEAGLDLEARNSFQINKTEVKNLHKRFLVLLDKKEFVGLEKEEKEKLEEIKTQLDKINTDFLFEKDEQNRQKADKFVSRTNTERQTAGFHKLGDQESHRIAKGDSKKEFGAEENKTA